MMSLCIFGLENPFKKTSANSKNNLKRNENYWPSVNNSTS